MYGGEEWRRVRNIGRGLDGGKFDLIRRERMKIK